LNLLSATFPNWILTVSWLSLDKLSWKFLILETSTRLTPPFYSLGWGFSCESWFGVLVSIIKLSVSALRICSVIVSYFLLGLNDVLPCLQAYGIYIFILRWKIGLGVVPRDSLGFKLMLLLLLLLFILMLLLLLLLLLILLLLLLLSMLLLLLLISM